ncbi:MAG: class I adenylate-forming enzyme family protein [Planctomycetota bacterium]
MRRISQAIQRHARHAPDQTLLHHEGHGLRYGQLPAYVHACAEHLSQTLPGPDPDRPVALVGGATPSLVVHLLALWQGGHGVLLLSDRLPEAERQRIVDQAGAHAWVHADQHDPEPHPDPAAPPVDLHGWLALPSSGVTGLPKVVRREAAAIDAVAVQVHDSVGYQADDRVFAAVPLTHAYGLEAGLLAPILAGARVELDSRFDPTQLGARLRETRATILPAVPAMVDMLVEMHAGPQDADPRPYPHIRKLLCAGAPLPEPLWRRCRDTLGLHAANYYGATEVGSVCLADPHDPNQNPAWIGRPMPGVRMAVVDTRTREPLPRGELGEIAIDAPSMMSGYLTGEPDLDRTTDRAVIDGRTCFLTGDLGVQHPDGAFQFVARQKLLIEVGANKVNPMEVEAILRLHPAVREALVTGDRCTPTITRLHARIEPTRPTETPSPADLRDHCRQHLAPWKIPRTFDFETLPRTALGKVIRTAAPAQAG